MSVQFREEARERLCEETQFSYPIRRLPEYWQLAAAGVILIAAAGFFVVFFL